MPGCAAPNCFNRSNKGYKMFRFPADPERRKKWIINSGRAEWEPTAADRLCSSHFEKSQFEQHRADGKQFLVPFAIPTIFSVSKKLHRSRSVYKRPYQTEEIIIVECENENPKKPCLSTELELASLLGTSANNGNAVNEVNSLKKQIHALEEKLKRQNESLSTFLTQEQIEKLQIEKKFIKNWSQESVVKSLKLRFALGKNGYNFLRATGYPAPSYSTLNKRVSSIKMQFGVLHSIMELLSKKFEAASDLEKDCSLIIDQIEITSDLEFDKTQIAFVGHVTLGDPTECGTYLTLVALRGISTPWKQIVACHVTGPSTSDNDMKSLIVEIIKAAFSVGLRVVSVTSAMENNEAMWDRLGVSATKTEKRTSFKIDENTSEINVLADGPYLLKNWMAAIQNSKINIPGSIVKENSLVTNEVSGHYIKTLWNYDVANKRVRFLHHLSAEILNFSHFSKISIDNAMKYISIKTAAALEAAVVKKVLPPAALTTAWFLRLLRQWYELIHSCKRAASITPKNFDKKKEFLTYFISIIEETVGLEEWKALNTGSVLTSLSIINISESCFQKGCKFLLGSRLSRDALDNIFCEIRKRAGKKPSALGALRATKLICLSQFMSDVKNSDYCTDSDLIFLDYSENK